MGKTEHSSNHGVTVQPPDTLATSALLHMVATWSEHYTMSMATIVCDEHAKPAKSNHVNSLQS